MNKPCLLAHNAIRHLKFNNYSNFLQTYFELKTFKKTSQWLSKAIKILQHIIWLLFLSSSFINKIYIFTPIVKASKNYNASERSQIIPADLIISGHKK